MKKLLAGLALIGTLGVATVTDAGPEKPTGPLKGLQVKIGNSWSMTVRFKGGERATVIVTGSQEQGHLGLYIYDSHGNCVARDDNGDGNVLNYRAAIWHPEKTQDYVVQVRNLGNVNDQFYLALR